MLTNEGLAEIRARVIAVFDEIEQCYRTWGVLPCPSCQAANARIAELEAELSAEERGLGKAH